MSKITPLAFDWDPMSSGDAGMRFQRMASDVVAAHLGLDNLTLGPTHTGRDGGNDGWYNGEIDGVVARWKIAFAVRAEFGTLLTKAQKEHDVGVRDGAEAILLCTPLNLNVDQVLEVEGILGADLKKGACWPRAKLEHHLRNHPWVACTHFDLQFLPGFVPLNSATELEISSQQDVPILGRADSLEAAGQFLDGSSRVLLVVAPGGAGKSRFLRELQRVGTRSGWLRRVGRGTIEDAIVRGLPRKKPLLLCMDDAGLAPDEALELARLSKMVQGDVDVKVVLATRVPDQFILERLCRDARVEFSTIQLAPLDSNAAGQLVDHECPGLERRGVEALLRFSGRNLFVLRAAAQLLATGERLADFVDQELLRGLLVDRLVNEAIGALSPLGVPDADVRKLLLRTALDAPLDAGVEQNDERLATLRRAALLRIVGHGMRFRADVEGDLLLGHMSREAWAQVCISQQLTAEPERTQTRLRNLAAAGDGFPASVVKRACADWFASASTTTAFGRRQIMRILPHAVAVAPAEVCALCQQYISIPPSIPTEAFELAFRGPRPTTDDFGPIVLALVRNHQQVAATALARLMFDAKVPEGMYSNYKVQTIGAEIVSPLHSRPAGVCLVLNEVERWLEETTTALPLDLLKSILDAALAGTFHWNRSTAVEFSYGEEPFAATPEVQALRADAVRVLHRLIDHADAQTRVTACKIIRNLGRGSMLASLADDLRPIVEKELASLLAHLSQRLEAETDFAVMDEIECGLLERWAAGRPGAETAEAILRGRTWPLLYRAYQFVHRPAEWTHRNEKVFELAPTQDRWKWWVERRRTEIETEAEVRALTESLRDTYVNDAALLEAIQALANAPYLFLLLDPWCALAQPLFAELQGRSDLSPELNDVVARVLRRHLFRGNPARAANEIVRIVDGASESEIGRLLEDADRLPLVERLLVARAMIADRRVSIRAMGLELAFRSTELTDELEIELLASALRDGRWRDRRQLDLPQNDNYSCRSPSPG